MIYKGELLEAKRKLEEMGSEIGIKPINLNILHEACVSEDLPTIVIGSERITYRGTRYYGESLYGLDPGELGKRELTFMRCYFAVIGQEDEETKTYFRGMLEGARNFQGEKYLLHLLYLAFNPEFKDRYREEHEGHIRILYRLFEVLDFLRKKYGIGEEISDALEQTVCPPFLMDGKDFVDNRMTSELVPSQS